MRRLYESSAVERDDGHAFTPRERDSTPEPQAFRYVPGNFLSRRLVPNRLRHAAIDVSIETDRETYAPGVPVSFVVTMKNRFPIPIEVPTRSPLLWSWAVDGAREAARAGLDEPPAKTRGFRFDRGERKQFRREWDQRFRVSASEWEQASPGEYVLSARLNVDDPAGSGVFAETTIRIDER